MYFLPSRGWGASKGNNPAPLDIRNRAASRLGFVLWKWLNHVLISKNIEQKVKRPKVIYVCT